MKEHDIDDHALSPGDAGAQDEPGLCPDCGGTGVSETGETCPACGGEGRLVPGVVTR
jgi:DnaJ-class molecular chaperone